MPSECKPVHAFMSTLFVAELLADVLTNPDSNG